MQVQFCIQFVFHTLISTPLLPHPLLPRPRLALLQIGRETLEEEFCHLLEDYKKKKDHDDIFDDLKSAVRRASMSRHKWEEKAEESLVRNTEPWGSGGGGGG